MSIYENFVWVAQFKPFDIISEIHYEF